MQERIGKKTESESLEANFTLSDDYVIIMGDERFYKLFGDKALYTFNMLVHMKDREDFKTFMESEEEEACVVVRCQVADDSYRWFILEKKSTVSEPKKMVHIKLQDIFVISRKFDLYYARMRKYRAVMNMIQDKMFEYNHNTGIFKIYAYINNRSEMIEKDNLDEWEQRMMRLGLVEEKQYPSFSRLCDNIRVGAESFSVTLRTALMSKGERTDVLVFKGQTIYDGEERVLTIGLITEQSNRMTGTDVLMDLENANKDSSTGVLNKKTITDEVTSAINLANVAGTDSSMYLMVWDIDDFKQVNDTYGHYFGDEVIKTLATELNRAVQNRGLVGRIGGDEFMVLLKENEGDMILRNFLTAVRKKLKIDLAQHKNDYVFSASIGISQYGKDGKDYETLFKIADGALYIAKEKGKDRFIIYDKHKHKMLLTQDSYSSKKAVTVGFMRTIDKVEFAANLMLRIKNGGLSVVFDALSELMDKMNVHGISIYEGNDMKCIKTLGHYEKKPEKADYILEDDYFEQFDEKHIHVINNTISMAVKYPKAYGQACENSICSALQIACMENGKVSAVYEFDIFGTNKRKWCQDDISSIYIVVKAIEDVHKNIREQR